MAKVKVWKFGEPDNFLEVDSEECCPHCSIARHTTEAGLIFVEAEGLGVRKVYIGGRFLRLRYALCEESSVEEAEKFIREHEKAR